MYTPVIYRYMDVACCTLRSLIIMFFHLYFTFIINKSGCFYANMSFTCLVVDVAALL